MFVSSTAGPRPGGYVSIDPEWQDETAFLICGGPSFAAVDVDLLRGRRVMVVNSSCYAVPFADILFFGDERWELNNRAAVKAFAGRVLSSSWGSVHCAYIEFLHRPKPSDVPPGLSPDRSEAWMRHTSARGAINVLCHLGVKRIVTLGLDGGTTHHHQPHPWGMNKDILDLQQDELKHVASALEARGVELLNASPGSKIPFWPIVKLEDVALKPALTVIGMLGIGDNLHQRAPLRALMQDHDVTLEGFYPTIVHDLVGAGLKFRQLKCHIAPRIKAGDGAQAPSRSDPKAKHTKLTYHAGSILKAGSILAAQFASCGLTMPERADFSLPVPEAWRARARKLMAGWDLGARPLLVYRPIVRNKIWDCPSRSPDPVAYAEIFAAIRPRFFVVSVADLTQDEWIVGVEQDADVKLHKGETDFEILAGIFSEAALVFCNPGFAPVLAQAVGTPSIIVYGGNESFRTTNSVGAHLAPTLAIEPIHSCECHARTHDCDKQIDLPAALARVSAFAERFG